MGEAEDKAAFLAKLREFEGMETASEVGADPVNLPMIRHWVEAMDDDNPVYTDPEAAAASVHGEIIAPQLALVCLVRVVAEPGGAAAFAALLSGRYRPAARERVGVLVCGGNTSLPTPSPVRP